MSTTCPRCRRTIEENDCYCRHCGKTLQPRMGFWYDHGGILLLTLIVGPFSLICVWMSHKISLLAKWIWTLCIGLLSYYLCYSIYRTIVLLRDTFLSLPAGF